MKEYKKGVNSMRTLKEKPISEWIREVLELKTLLRSARDVLLLNTLIDKSDHSMNEVNKIDKILAKYYEDIR